MFEAIKAKRLIAKLQGNNLDKNLEVIERLAQIRHPSAIGPIIESLKGLPIARHEERISQAVASFGTDAVAPLIGLLSDALSSTRRLAALTLGRIGDPRAIAPLVKLQLYGDPEVAGKTLHALKSIDENWAKTSQARQVIPDLLEAFHTETSYRRLRAAETLDKIDPGWTAHIRTQELTNALLDSLVDSPSSSEHTLALLDRFCPQWSKDPRARKAGRKLSAQREDTQLTPEACAAMARSGNTACIADLIESIPTQGNNALKALKAMGPDWKQSVTQAHLRRLFDVLFTSSPALGFRVIPSRLGVNASVPLISSPLPGGGPSTGQRNAAAALAEIGSEQVVDTLIEALERGLRREAEDRAKRQPRAVDADGLSPLGESLKDQTERLLSQFRRAPKPVEPKLDLSLVPETLGKIGNAKALGILVRTLNSENRRLRDAAVAALGALGDPRAIVPLTMLLAAPPEGNNYLTSDHAASALEQIDSNWHQTEWAKQGIGPLIRRLANTNRRTRDRAASFLDKIGPTWMEAPQAREVLPVLVNALHIHPSIAWRNDRMDGYDIGLFRAGLADALLGIGDARAVWPLLEASRDGLGAAEMVKCAQQLLEKHASEMTEDDLRQIAEMEAVEHIHFKAQCAYMVEDHREPVDLSFVRQMARQELSSRK